jgi:hypothetical protein
LSAWQFRQPAGLAELFPQKLSQSTVPVAFEDGFDAWTTTGAVDSPFATDAGFLPNVGR